MADWTSDLHERLFQELQVLDNCHYFDHSCDAAAHLTLVAVSRRFFQAQVGAGKGIIKMLSVASFGFSGGAMALFAA